ncbi:MAG: class I SAM-dependent methyltransferase, partial [bacterium]|nr:class I SAM-dependent methyltransferase [bacterium]
MWTDYELIDSGNGKKFERFGQYTFVRPESQAIWFPKNTNWQADGVFVGDEEAGRWRFNQPVPQRWEMIYGGIKFWAEATPFRHLGVFPEQFSQWEWMVSKKPQNVLNLFGYTGIASLILAKNGTKVTHVDASKKTIFWARENQKLSGLEDKPIRWIFDDALKFVEREARRGVKYDGIILDPPKFGRGPAGEIWKIEESLPALLLECANILCEKPLFVNLTTYAIRLSSYS